MRIVFAIIALAYAASGCDNRADGTRSRRVVRVETRTAIEEYNESVREFVAAADWLAERTYGRSMTCPEIRADGSVYGMTAYPFECPDFPHQ